MEKVTNKICEETKESEKCEWYQSLQTELKDAKNSNFEKIFKTHAEELMSHYALTNGNETFLFKEIEYYFYDKDRHPDPYVNKNEKQNDIGGYYFHASGLDITFGQDGFYGGILIRGIQKNDDQQQTFGPIDSMAKLFSIKISDYNKSYYLNLTESANHNIRVCKLDSEQKLKEVLASTRVGLNPKPCDYQYFCNNDKQVVPFIFKKYRFLSSDRSGTYSEKLKVAFYNSNDIQNCVDKEKKNAKNKI